MKKKLKNIVRCIFGAMVIIPILFHLWEVGAFILVPSAEVCLEGLIWNGKTYSRTSGEYSEGRTIAKGKNNWKINMVEEDPSHKFIVARSFLDNHLYVSDDYIVPTEGKITTVSWNGKYITDELFLDAISNIEMKKTTKFTYKTDNISGYRDTQQMRDLYFAYEGCPVTTVYKGYMGKVNGEWVITTDVSWEIDDDGYLKQCTVSCYKIPSEYWDILSKYFDLISNKK